MKNKELIQEWINFAKTENPLIFTQLSPLNISRFSVST